MRCRVQDRHVTLHSLVLADGDQGADIDKIQGVRQCRANSCSSEIPRTCQKYANVWDLEVLSEEGDAQGIQEETKRGRRIANRSQTHYAPTGRRWRREPDLGEHLNVPGRRLKDTTVGDTCISTVTWVGARVAWINGAARATSGLQLATLSSVPVSTPLCTNGNGATVGQA